MKRLQRYILTEFARLLVITLVSFILLFTLVDLFENMDNLIESHVPLLPSIAFFFYNIPYIVSEIAPMATLLSVLLTLGILARHGEITAIKAGGIRLFSVLSPLFVFGLFISAGLFIMNETVTPVMNQRAAAFSAKWFDSEHVGTFGKEGLWVKSAEGIYNIRGIDLVKKRLHGLDYYQIAKPFKVTGRVKARDVIYDGAQWVTGTATVWKFPENGRALRTSVDGYVVEGLAGPEEMAGVEQHRRDMPIGELMRYIRGLEADGYDSARYRTDLYNRVSFPLINFIMVFIGIPFALKTGRHSSIAVGVGISVIIALSYWIIFAATTSLGHGGVIPPLMAAAFPDVLFFAVGALMYAYVRQ
jgi:lipopolysaccharide export system permease protein